MTKNVIEELRGLYEAAEKSGERLEAASKERFAAAGKTNEAFGIAAWAKTCAAFDEAYNEHYAASSALDEVARKHLAALLAAVEAAKKVYLIENDITAPDYELNAAVRDLGNALSALTTDEGETL